MNANNPRRDYAPNRKTDEKTLRRFYRTAMKNPFLSAAVVTVFVVIFLAVCGPLLPPHDPVKTDLSFRLAPPSLQYPLGNDALGRGLLSRIL